MPGDPLVVFALQQSAPPLRSLVDALRQAGFPAGIGVSIAGNASDAALDEADWDAFFLRWLAPDVHEVALIERALPGMDEEADLAISEAVALVTGAADEAGRLIVADHLQRTAAVYVVEPMPPLLEIADHPGWAGLDVVIRTLAEETAGLIYARGEGYYDSDGELLLAEEANAEEDEADTVGGVAALGLPLSSGDSNGHNHSDGA